MHLQIIVRGILPQVRLWESMMQNHHFKWKRINIKTKKEEIVLVQGGLRTSVLGTYEFIFPEESLPEVLSFLGFTDKSKIEAIPSFMNKTKLAVLRKLCGVKKIPKSAFEEAKKIQPTIYFKDYERGLSTITVPGVSVHPIGIREDGRRELFDPAQNKTFEQEML